MLRRISVLLGLLFCAAPILAEDACPADAAAACPAAAAGKCPMAASQPSGDAKDWKVLFDGSAESLAKNWDFKAGGWNADGGLLVTGGKAGDIYTKEKFQDLVLDVEFRNTPGCNSGVFVRMADRKDWLHSSIEIQVLDSFAKAAMDKHDCGAAYDLLAPAANAVRKPGEWNRFFITCRKNRLWVVLNGVQVIDMDLNKWSEAGKSPDGTKNKFRDPIAKIQQAGFVALQGHGSPEAFRNVRLMEIKDGTSVAKCPGCGMVSGEGVYCSRCNAVCTSSTAAGDAPKFGTWSEKDNAFLFPAGAPKCKECGDAKGAWCRHCGKYFLCEGVTYCEKCKKPYAESQGKGCPNCRK